MDKNETNLAKKSNFRHRKLTKHVQTCPKIEKSKIERDKIEKSSKIRLNQTTIDQFGPKTSHECYL